MTSKIAQYIEAERVKMNLSQIELLEMTQLSPKSVGRIWNRLRNNTVKLYELFEILSVLEINFRIFKGQQRISYNTDILREVSLEDFLKVTESKNEEVVVLKRSSHNGEFILNRELSESIEVKKGVQGRRRKRNYV